MVVLSMNSKMKIMKLFKYYFYFILTAFLFSCSEEDFNPDQNILGLGGDDVVQTEVDNWIHDNLVQDYNIDVKYKWDQSELDLNKTLVPIKEDLVVPVMNVVKKVWIEPYEMLVGANFIRQLAPKRYVLVGSPEYNSDGTIKVGEAEGGKKITIFRLNWFSSTDKELIQEIMKTVHHEFGHTMHQTVMYPIEFKSITPGGYVTAWSNTDDSDAIKLGYISKYARSGPDEDFVEMISRIAVYGREWYEDRVAKAQAVYDDPAQNVGMAYNPAEALRQKESMVVNYLKDTWGVDFYDHDGEKGLVSLVQDAINSVVSEAN